MHYTKEIFDLLSDRKFLAVDTPSSVKYRWFVDVDENYEEYAGLYASVGFRLERGNGYFCFSRQEGRQRLEDKLKSLYEWIDRLDLMLTFKPSFEAGCTFSKAELQNQIDTDPELREKAQKIYDKKTAGETTDKIIADLTKYDVVELLEEYGGRYKVTAGLNYFLTLMRKFDIMKEAENEMPE